MLFLAIIKTRRERILTFLFSYKTGFLPFQNYHKDLDPSSKMDLDLWGSFGRGKIDFKAELLDRNKHICQNFGGINFHLITK